MSRKAFDTGAGGMPSPVLPDGRLVALPIPDKSSPIRYGDITWDGINLGELVATLSRGRILSTHFAHLDPDLNPASLPRSPGWRPVFGQEGSAQGHLRNQGVGPGDLFLFFGLFGRTRDSAAGLVWARDALPRHLLWGWLQVDRVVTVDACEAAELPWARYHPHFHRGPSASNTLYLPRDQLTLEGQPTGLPGAGHARRAVPELTLTARDASTTSEWDVPGWMVPGPGAPALTYHNNAARWRPAGERARLTAVSRGQEFVLDTAHYPQATSWATSLIEHAAS